jgi:hypothetical protein
VSDRERKRAQRQKRKARGAERRAATSERRAAMAERSEAKNRAAREKLEPLAPTERPTVVTIGAALTGLVAAAIVIAYVAGAEVNGKRPPIVQVITPTILMGMASYGLWRARYWAALGFEVILAFLLIAAFFGLIKATSAVQVVGNVVLISVAGALFYFMVKAMARLQMPERRTPGAR